MFDEKKARRVVRFIECLKHTKGEFHGKPFKLLPWQEKIIRDVFGTVRDEDPEMRQYNQVYIEIGKKNGKSELGAALALNMLINDDEWKAEVYSCASDRQQAAIVFDVAVDMVRQNPTLSRLIKIIPSTKRMVYQPTGSIYQVLSSEVATKHGLNVSACIFDELHTQPTRALYDVMTQGSGDARRQPLWFFLTTAGTDRNPSLGGAHRAGHEPRPLHRKGEGRFLCPVQHGRTHAGRIQGTHGGLRHRPAERRAVDERHPRSGEHEPRARRGWRKRAPRQREHGFRPPGHAGRGGKHDAGRNFGGFNLSRKLTLGSLFDGIGGFPLAGKMAGITPVWASEIEPFPIRVTEKRLPEMKHYGDIASLRGGDLGAVDVITFGSPC